MRTGNGRSRGPHDRYSDWTEWRTRLLVEVGFPVELADRLARQDEMDLHALLELVDRGCPPHLAIRILAPLCDSSTPE